MYKRACVCVSAHTSNTANVVIGATNVACPSENKCGGGECKLDRDGLYDGQTETKIEKINYGKPEENREDNNNMSSTGGQTSDNNNWL